MSSAIEPSRKLRRQKEGEVVGTKMDKTIIVRVDRRIRHRLYKKELTRSKKYYVRRRQEGFDGRRGPDHGDQALQQVEALAACRHCPPGPDVEVDIL